MDSVSITHADAPASGGKSDLSNNYFGINNANTDATAHMEIYPHHGKSLSGVGSEDHADLGTGSFFYSPHIGTPSWRKLFEPQPAHQ